MAVTSELNAVLKFNSILGLLPAYNSSNSTFSNRNSCVHFLGVIYAVASICAFIGILSSGHSAEHFWVFTAFLLLLFGVHAIATVHRTTINAKKCNDLIAHFNAIDGQFAQRFRKESASNARPTLHLAATSFLYAVITTCDTYSWLRSNLINMLPLYLPVPVFIYLTITSDILQITCLRLLLERFRTFNVILKELRDDAAEKSDAESKIKALIAAKESLSRVNDLCDELFGYNLLTLQLFSMVSVLIICDAYINDTFYFDVFTAVVSCIWSIINVIYAVIPTIIAESIIKEGRKSVGIACMLYNKFCEEPFAQTSLATLIHHINNRKPTFTAAGFYNVNYEMIFNFFNLFTTYTIVVFQFKNS